MRSTFCFALALAGCASATSSATIPSASSLPPTVTAPIEAAVPAPEEACGAFEVAADEDAGYFVSDREATWEPGSTLNVAFLDGKPAWRLKVAEVAREWEQYANIRFAFEPPVEVGKADIRISFKGGGYWSAIGSNGVYRPGDKPTMNFHCPLMAQGDREIHRVVMHEFGHSLGLWHEHQNPNLKVTWNKEFMYAYYQRTQGWDRAQVDRQVLTPLSADKVDAKEFDPASIMLYPMLADFTVEKLVTPRNFDVSAIDKKYIGQLYPGRDKPSPDETMAAAKQVKFKFAIVADVPGEKVRQRYAASIDAPAAVLASIDQVMYQRQDATFAEFKAGTYVQRRTPDAKFAFEWTGYSVSPIKVRIAWRSGIVTAATYTTKPEDQRLARDWKKLAAKVAFGYTSMPIDGKWARFTVAMTTKEAAPAIAFIEYQRQHETFAEFRGDKALASDKATDGFVFAWRGYGWVPVKAIVHFKNGDVKEYAVPAPTPAPP
ncbi:MAG: M12 family metallopeptidase [Proteobacteria bacterium]|nr:M12 family metallopeptidase [Pseudomonadota bacterium]